MFEITIQFTDVKHNRLSNRVIDIYGSYKERSYYTEGLISKLKAWMPRIGGRIILTNPDKRTIIVDLGKEYNVFDNMDLLLYDVVGSGENTRFVERCNAKANIEDFSASQISAEVVGCKRRTYWADVVKQWKRVRVVSK